MLAIPARAHSSSCSRDDAPPTPQAPSIWPFRKIGNPPRIRIAGNTLRSDVDGRRMVDDAFNLGTWQPSARGDDGLPIENRLTSAYRNHASERDEVAELVATATLTVLLNSRAFAIATSTIEFASRLRVTPTTSAAFRPYFD